MEINKQLFEDVLSGKLKGTFVLRNGNKYFSAGLHRNYNKFRFTHPYVIGFRSYTPKGTFLIYSGNTLDIIDFIPYTDMKENELTIEIPDGKIVDWDESKKQNKIVLKDKQLTYEDVCKKLFKDGHFYITSDNFTSACDRFANTQHQLECILAKNKLANVAKCLNDGWKPNKGSRVFTITYYGDFKNTLIVSEYYFGNGENLILFKTQKDAQQAIEILGEETVKLALEPLGI